MQKTDNIQEAKKSLKYHIKFLESLKRHVSGEDKIMKYRALWTAWCLHDYINNHLIEDVENAIRKFGDKDERETTAMDQDN